MDYKNEEFLFTQEYMKPFNKLPDLSNETEGVYLFLDTETTGFPQKGHASPANYFHWPYILELAWILTDEKGLRLSHGHYILRQNVCVPKQASDINKITTEKMLLDGVDPELALNEFLKAFNNCKYIIAHNLDFDRSVIECEFFRHNILYSLLNIETFCTMHNGKRFCTVYDKSGHVKNAKLSELFGGLYFNDTNISIEGIHNALADTLLLYYCFKDMIKKDSHLLDPPPFVYPNYAFIDEDELEEDLGLRPLSNEEIKNYFPEFDLNNDQVLVTGVEEKEPLWDIISQMNGKITKSVSKNLGILVVGASPGKEKLKKVAEKIANGESILIITDLQLILLYDKFKSLIDN